jgi:hypothetical protein
MNSHLRVEEEAILRIYVNLIYKSFLIPQLLALNYFGNLFITSKARSGACN